MVTLTANASDDNAVANVSLFFRFSADNSSWSTWTLFGIDSVAPWNWSFNFSNGAGYYQFYSIATDNANNVEAAPSTADASCAFDPFAPTITDTSAFSANTGGTFLIRASVMDAFSLAGVQATWWFGNGTHQTIAMSHTTGNHYELTVNISLNSTAMLHYQITASDKAANVNSTSIKDVVVVDNIPPIAKAGSNQTVNISKLVTLDGTGSRDNIGIVNYTWTFIYNGTGVALYNATSKFTFWVKGNYSVALNVSDAAGLWATDSLTIHVLAPIPPANNTNNTQNQTASSKGFLDNYWWVIVVAVIAAMVVATIVIIRKRPKIGNEPPSETDDKKEGEQH